MCSSQNCSYTYYTAYDEKHQNWLLVHPESYETLRRLLKPDPSPHEVMQEIKTLLENWIKYNPLSGSMIKIVREDFETNSKRKRADD